MTLGAFFLILFPSYSQTQLEAPLFGNYEVMEGAPIETINISAEKVEAFVNSEVVERFFFHGKEEDHYIFEKVKLDVNSIDPSILKDRKLYDVQMTHLSSEEILLNLVHPNGNEQEIRIKKID